MLWAWERPEDLTFLNPSTTGVALLVGTIRLSSDRVVAVPRLQPLALPRGTAVLPVVRVETSLGEPPALSREQRQEVAAAVFRFLRDDAKRLQIDFDARRTERPFYAELLGDLRRRLPGAYLSITALASWCIADPWIEGLPVDEAVPMLFRMGVGDGEVRRHLALEGDFRVRFCRESAGVATDESPPSIPGGRRRYVFHPAPWSASAYRLVEEDPS